ncbi:MAG: response regulator [Bryobacteraceae bacterium]
MKLNGAPVSIATVSGASNFPDARIRIMIADDHEIFRDGLRNLLTAQPDLSVVAEAARGEDVPALVREHEPDILLLDLQIRGADGIATLQRLQAMSVKTRIIIMTASDDKEEHLRALRSGTSGIVQKKTPTEMLLKSIRKVHSGEIWLDRTTTAEVMRKFAALRDGAPGFNGVREREASPLSNREREIVALVSQGFKNKEMAEKMFISEQTVKNHLHNIFDKLGVSDRLELALYAIHKNWHESA